MSRTTISTDCGGRPTEITVSTPDDYSFGSTREVNFMDSFANCILAVAASHGLDAAQVAQMLLNTKSPPK